MNEDMLVRQWSGLASVVSREFFHPLIEPDDMRQEALIGLMEAARGFDATRGASFKTYAGLVIRRRLNDVLRTETRMKRHGNVEALREIVLQDGPVEAITLAVAPNADAHELIETRDEIRRIVRGVNALSPLERRAVVELLNGVKQDKQTDNALMRARAKLRTAA